MIKTNSDQAYGSTIVPQGDKSVQRPVMNVTASYKKLYPQPHFPVNQEILLVKSKYQTNRLDILVTSLHRPIF